MLKASSRLARPFVIAQIASQVLRGALIMRAHAGFGSVLLTTLSYGSLVQAPGISLLDAAVYFAAGVYAARRTHSIRTAMLAGATTSFAGVAALFTTFAILQPDLLLTPFRGPFIFVILGTLLAIAVGTGALTGALGGVCEARLKADTGDLRSA
jgi:hypothetical protein